MKPNFLAATPVAPQRSQLDEDDDLTDGEDIQAMEIPSGFRLQASAPAALDGLLLKRGVLLRLGLGWFGGVITRRAQERNRSVYDYRVMLETDESTLRMKLPLDAYSTDENAAVGAWALLEPVVDSDRSTAEGAAGGQGGGDEDEAGVRRSARAPVPNVRHLPLQS